MTHYLMLLVNKVALLRAVKCFGDIAVKVTYSVMENSCFHHNIILQN